jgi:hypothetical protein
MRKLKRIETIRFTYKVLFVLKHKFYLGNKDWGCNVTLITQLAD